MLRFSRPLLIRIAKNAMVVGLNCDRIVHDLCYTVFVWLLVRSCSQIVFSLPKKCVCVLVVAFVYNRFACTVFATHTHKNRSASPILKQNEALSMPGPMSHAINKLNYFDENTLLFFFCCVRARIWFVVAQWNEIRCTFAQYYNADTLFARYCCWTLCVWFVALFANPVAYVVCCRHKSSTWVDMRRTIYIYLVRRICFELWWLGFFSYRRTWISVLKMKKRILSTGNKKTTDAKQIAIKQQQQSIIVWCL